MLTPTFNFSFYSWQRRKLSYLCDTLHINQAGNLPRFVAGILCLSWCFIWRFRTPVWSVNAPTAWLV